MKVARTAAPVRQQTLHNLRSAIVQGRFAPGQRLIEKELCQLTGVSRTPVREALRQLETEGLITLTPNVGPRVAVLSVQDARDIYQIRRQLECLACRLFAERATAGQRAALTRLLARMKKAVADNRSTRYLDLNDELYQHLFDGCGNRLVSQILNPIKARIAFMRRRSLERSGRPRQSLDEVERIVAAIGRRDPQAAAVACREHLMEVEAVMLTLMRNEARSAGGLDCERRAARGISRN